MKYGNCLVAALVAKIKDPKNIKIIKISKNLSIFGDVFHYAWLDINTNTVHHFVRQNKNGKWFWFKGEEKVVSKAVFDRFILDKINRYTESTKNNLLKKFNVQDTYNKFKWHDPSFGELPSYEDGIPYTDRIPYIEVIYGTKPDYKMELLKIEKDKKINLPYNTIFWRYQSIYNDTFNGLWNVPGKRCEYIRVNKEFAGDND